MHLGTAGRLARFTLVKRPDGIYERRLLELARRKAAISQDDLQMACQVSPHMVIGTLWNAVITAHYNIRRVIE